MKTAVIYIHHGLADWEAGFVLPELAKAGFQITSVAESLDPIKTMGGLKIVPDSTISNTNWEDVAILILPGGDSWMSPDQNKEILKLLPRLRERHVIIAAICGATVGLGRIGFLDHQKHTSNYLPLLKMAAPDYIGDEFYQDDLAVSDGNLITASGIGAVEFTREILKSLQVYPETKCGEWYQLFKNARIPAWLGVSD